MIKLKSILIIIVVISSIMFVSKTNAQSIKEITLEKSNFDIRKHVKEGNEDIEIAFESPEAKEVRKTLNDKEFFLRTHVEDSTSGEEYHETFTFRKDGRYFYNGEYSFSTAFIEKIGHWEVATIDGKTILFLKSLDMAKPETHKPEQMLISTIMITENGEFSLDEGLTYFKVHGDLARKKFDLETHILSLELQFSLNFGEASSRALEEEIKNGVYINVREEKILGKVHEEYYFLDNGTYEHTLQYNNSEEIWPAIEGYWAAVQFMDEDVIIVQEYHDDEKENPIGSFAILLAERQKDGRLMIKQRNNQFQLSND